MDADVATARELIAMEMQLGARSSSYFRLSTFDERIMREIEAAGSEASYHFEEIASVSKQIRLRSRAEVMPYLSLIRDTFTRNLLDLRKRTGLPMRSVASHGDFVNRFLKMPNWELLTPQLREELSIDVEAYDPEFTRLITSRHSDNQYPNFWRPSHPIGAILSGEPVIKVLTHPRHWRRNVWANLGDDSQRLWQGVTYHSGRPPKQQFHLGQ